MIGLKEMGDLEEELRLLQAKLVANEQKKLILYEIEGRIRTEMQHIQNQIFRLKKAQEKTPE